MLSWFVTIGGFSNGIGKQNNKPRLIIDGILVEFWALLAIHNILIAHLHIVPLHLLLYSQPNGIHNQDESSSPVGALSGKFPKQKSKSSSLGSSCLRSGAHRGQHRDHRGRLRADDVRASDGRGNREPDGGDGAVRRGRRLREVRREEGSVIACHRRHMTSIPPTRSEAGRGSCHRCHVMVPPPPSPPPPQRSKRPSRIIGNRFEWFRLL